MVNVFTTPESFATAVADLGRIVNACTRFFCQLGGSFPDGFTDQFPVADSALDLPCIVASRDNENKIRLCTVLDGQKPVWPKSFKYRPFLKTSPSVRRAMIAKIDNVCYQSLSFLPPERDFLEPYLILFFYQLKHLNDYDKTLFKVSMHWLLNWQLNRKDCCIYRPSTPISHSRIVPYYDITPRHLAHLEEEDQKLIRFFSDRDSKGSPPKTMPYKPEWNICCEYAPGIFKLPYVPPRFIKPLIDRNSRAQRALYEARDRRNQEGPFETKLEDKKGNVKKTVGKRRHTRRRQSLC